MFPSNFVYNYVHYPYVILYSKAVRNGTEYPSAHVNVYCPDCTFRDLGPDTLFISAYPNPVADVLTVTYDEKKYETQRLNNATGNLSARPVFEILLHDHSGNLLRRSIMNDSSHQLNVSDLPEGIYYLNVRNVSDGKVGLQQAIRKRN